MSFKLPDGVTEDDFIDIVNSISKKLCDKFKFGYFDREDIKQECFILAMDALSRYDSDRPLINFLWSHIHNRLCNLKRDKYFRLEKPCFKCPLNAYVAKDDLCTAYDNKEDCSFYAVWLEKNTSKQNIMNPIGMSCMNDENEQRMKNNDSVFSNVANDEILNIVDNNISISMRKYWLQQRAGIRIPKKHYDLLIEEIHQILKDNNIDVSQAW